MNKYDNIPTLNVDQPKKLYIDFDFFDEIVIKTNGSEVVINKDKLLMLLIEFFRQ